MKKGIGLLVFIFLFIGCSERDVLEPINASPLLSGEYLVVLDGDSRTDGWNCKNEYPYMNILSLPDSIKTQKVSYGGASSWELNHRQDDCYKLLYEPNGVNLIVLWIGVNDITVHNQTAEGIFENIQKYCASRREDGWKIILCTEISMKGARDSLQYDNERLRLNRMIRLNWMQMADGLADLGSNTEIGQLGAYHDPLYFCDGIHLTNRGTHEVSKIIERAIKSCMGIPIYTEPNFN